MPASRRLSTGDGETTLCRPAPMSSARIDLERTDREAVEVLTKILHRQLLHRAGPRISCHNRINASALVPAVRVNGNAGESTSAFRRRVRGSWAAAAASVARQAGTRANVVVIILPRILRSTWENPSETPWIDWKCRRVNHIHNTPKSI